MEIRTTQPKNNKYYITKSKGGYSSAIVGKPTIAGANVLCNCVGYAGSRFNEIIGKHKEVYVLVCNAENFIESAKKQGLKISSKPMQGGIMVWQKGNTLGGGDGAGHVAVVELVYDDGSILTSESGYNAWAFKTVHRNNSNGRWSQTSAYKFRGCIINPYVDSKVEPAPKLTVDGIGGTATVRAMQSFFSTAQDGVISGQTASLMTKYCPSLKSYKSGKGGSPCIKNLQKWVGVSQDGVIGQSTVKAWQKKLGVTADGIFGTASMKAWQKYLNTHDKAEYPTPTPTATVKIGQATKDYDHKAGDSSGKEVLKSNFKYSTSSTNCYNWTYVFRPKDQAKAEKSASMCEKAIANNNIGYNSHGETAYGKDKAMTKLAKAVNYDLSKITTKCGLSCGDLICLCNHYAGLSTCYIGSGLQLANNLKKNSNFECLNYKKGMTLKRGDVLITAHSNGKNNHVAMVL